jgi:hypothetical protein
MLQPWQNVQSERKRGLPPAFHLLHDISKNSEETGGIPGLQHQGIEVWQSAYRSYLPIYLSVAARRAMKRPTLSHLEFRFQLSGPDRTGKRELA